MNGELQRRYEKLLEAKAKEILLHEEEEQHKEVKNLRKEAALMRKRNRRNGRGSGMRKRKRKPKRRRPQAIYSRGKNSGLGTFLYP